MDLLPLAPQTAEHLATYASMDVSLDTFPYAGTTTSCESLYMGALAFQQTCLLQCILKALLDTSPETETVTMRGPPSPESPPLHGCAAADSESNQMEMATIVSWKLCWPLLMFISSHNVRSVIRTHSAYLRDQS